MGILFSSPSERARSKHKAKGNKAAARPRRGKVFRRTLPTGEPAGYGGRDRALARDMRRMSGRRADERAQRDGLRNRKDALNWLRPRSGSKDEDLNCY